MAKVGLGDFIYQGVSIPIPTSFSIDHITEQNGEVIFDCNGKNCNICEKCLIDNVYENVVPNDSKNLAIKLIKLPEAKLIKERHTKTPTNNIPTDLGEDFLSTETLLMSLLWNSVKKANQQILNKTAQNNFSDNIDKEDSQIYNEYKNSNDSIVIDLDLEGDIYSRYVKNIRKRKNSESKFLESSPPSKNMKIQIKNKNLSNDKEPTMTSDISVNTNKSIVKPSEKNTNQNKKKILSNAEPVEKKKGKLSIGDILIGNIKARSISTYSKEANLMNSNSENTNISSLSSQGGTSPSKDTVNASYTSETASSTVNDKVVKKNITCYGKIRNREWGCNANFKSMEDLKQHWMQPAGRKCLASFTKLRR